MTRGGRDGGTDGGRRDEGAPGPPGDDGSDGPPGGISCEEALSRVYEYLDGELESETQERIHRHLEICRRCYPCFDFERLFLDYVREKASAGERREGLEEAVRRMLREEGA